MYVFVDILWNVTLMVNFELLNGRTLVRRGFAVDLNGLLANPPGVIFPRTQADVLRTLQKSTEGPKICGGFATDPPQVCGKAMDLFVMKRNSSVLVL